MIALGLLVILNLSLKIGNFFMVVSLSSDLVNPKCRCDSLDRFKEVWNYQSKDFVYVQLNLWFELRLMERNWYIVGR